MNFVRIFSWPITVYSHMNELLPKISIFLFGFVEIIFYLTPVSISDFNP